MKSKKNSNSKRAGVAVDALVRLFPHPWSFDVSPQETPPARNSAMIYAADSTRICETRGEHAEALAELIVESVNHFPPNVPDDQQPLASGVAPAREADQQETCQKSRRDGCLVDRLVSIIV